MSLTFNADGSVNRTQTISIHSAMPGNPEQECRRPSAPLPRGAVQCSRLAEKREKKWLEVPCTGGIKVPSRVNGQNHPM